MKSETARAAFEADLEARIAGTVLEPYLEKLLEQVKAHINIQLERVAAKDIPHLASRMAGAPDLPPDFEWPEYEGEPLNFIAQFNLEHVAPFDTFEQLPKTGMLSFFHHELGTVPEDSSAWRVCLHPLEPLERHILPYVLSRDVVPCLATFETTYAFSYSEPLVDYTSDEDKAQSALADRLGKCEYTHLLGVPMDSCAMDIEDILLEIMMDESNLVQWCGAAIFCLSEADLKAQNFEEVWIETTSD